MHDLLVASDLYKGNPYILTLKQVLDHRIKPDGNAFLIPISKMAMQARKQQPPQVKHMTKLFALAHTQPIVSLALSQENRPQWDYLLCWYYWSGQ